jgi:hypothetical protein
MRTHPAEAIGAPSIKSTVKGRLVRDDETER